MGGNVKLNGYEPEPITIEHREILVANIVSFMTDLNTQIEMYGWSTQLDEPGLYSGSTRHFMDLTIPTPELALIKCTFGDIDIIVPREKQHILEAVLEELPRIGAFKVVGMKRFGGQTTALMQWHTGQVFQFDFEYKPFFQGYPTEFATWSQSSDLQDMRLGIKGAAHKMLILALTAKDQHRGIVYRYGKRGLGVATTERVRRYTFSQMYGVRVKHIEYDADPGMICWVDAADYYPEAPEYYTNLGEIFELLFNTKIECDADQEAFGSFIGTMALMKKHLTEDQQINVLLYFINQLFDKRAANHMGNDRKSDESAKDFLIAIVKRHFPNYEWNEPFYVKSIEHRKDEYYANY